MAPSKNVAPKRTFTVIETTTTQQGTIEGREKLGGVYKGTTPVSAAKKAASKLFAGGTRTITVKIQEITRGSKRKMYAYRVERQRTDRVVRRGDKEITIRYTLVAHSLNKKA